MKLAFAMPMRLKASLATGSRDEQSAYKSWVGRFGWEKVYLVGWCDSAYTVVSNLGDYQCENISGKPDFLFEAVLE